MPAPPAVLELVERFRSQYDSYKSPDDKEFALRKEFIDPFFAALGWDVENRQGYAEAYKEVVHEDSLRIGGAAKAPDYSFRIGGLRKFFVETKKPSVNIALDASPAYQLRRYAWSAKLPLSILTDFEEFAVYDCRIRPEKGDKASTARILLLRFEEYDAQWDRIAEVFSREAILRGAFDRYADSTRKKRGTAEVDDAFLAEIEGWRNELARNMALRNLQLDQRELNAAVQKTIDRIIFLRICEDRGIERYGQLQGLANGPNTYKLLCQVLERADERFNSGLFHVHEEKGRSEASDEWMLKLAVDDKPLKEIIRHLYYPDSPYEFSVIGGDILGQVYEQFLGKVIRLTSGHRAVVEDKPDVKKAGGVFYTPTYIVDYIVQNTVGSLLAGKSPHDVAGRTAAFKPKKGAQPVTVLDPACGSGSFLIGAYQFLLDWYRDRYLDEGAAKHKERLYQTREDRWRLTTAERKRILLDHIYGVDIDPQAVEVTKLSLLLKVLEGENEETLAKQLRLFKERALPDLGDNIKCGNSLIGGDFFNGRQRALFDDDELLRINAFDWRKEFRAIMEGGGFDAVIGNPPYVRMDMFKDIKDYLRAHYASHGERTDLYVYFIEREHELLREGGRFGMIVSNKFLRANYGEAIRRRLAEVAEVDQVVDLAGLPVFRGATVRTVVIISRRAAGKASSAGKVSYCPPVALDEFRAIAAGTMPLADVVSQHQYKVSRRRLAHLRPFKQRLEGRATQQEWYELQQPQFAYVELMERPKLVFPDIATECRFALDVGGHFGANTVYFIPSDDPALLALLNSSLAQFFFAQTCAALEGPGEQYLRFFGQYLEGFPVCLDVIADRQRERLARLGSEMTELAAKVRASKTEHQRTAIQRQFDSVDADIDRTVYECYGLSEAEAAIVEGAT